MGFKDKAATFILPSLRDIFFIAVFAGVIIQGPRLINTDGDLGHHLAMGRLILESKEIPNTDPFSFRTEGRLAIPHEWLSQCLFSAIDAFMGLNGIVIFCALVVAGAFTWVLIEANKRSKMTIIALVLTALAVAASTIHWIARPHLITFLLLAAWTFNLESLWRGEHRRWWLFPLLMVLWANLHGMFVLGLVTWIFYAAAYLWERMCRNRAALRDGLGKELLLIGVTCLPATLLTPSGIHIWTTIFNLAGSQYITSMTLEYRSPDFHLPGTWPFLILLGITIISLARGRSRLNTPSVISLSAWILLGLYSARNIPLAVVVMAPITAESLASWINAAGSQKWRAWNERLSKIEQALKGHAWPLACMLIISTALGLGYRLDPGQKGNQFDSQIFPVQAAAWLEDHPQEGNMFNDFNWGGYLLYELWPGYKIFMDGHTHVYGDELSREYVSVASLQDGWETTLEEYDVGWVIMPRDSLFIRHLSSDPAWNRVYIDDTAAIFKKH